MVIREQRGRAFEVLHQQPRLFESLMCREQREPSLLPAFVPRRARHGYKGAQPDEVRAGLVQHLGATRGVFPPVLDACQAHH